MSFPTTNVHRRNRRKLGRGQFPPNSTVGVVQSSTGTTNVTLTFARPVVVRGNLTNTVATRTLVSQTQTAPNIVSQVWSGNVTALVGTVPAAMPNLSGVIGGTNASNVLTFP
jgi:hypothetical protein